MDRIVEYLQKQELQGENKDKIAEFIHMTITDFDNNKEAVIKGVAELISQYPLY